MCLDCVDAQIPILTSCMVSLTTIGLGKLLMLCLATHAKALFYLCWGLHPRAIARRGLVGKHVGSIDLVVGYGHHDIRCVRAWPQTLPSMNQTNILKRCKCIGQLTYKNQ